MSNETDAVNNRILSWLPPAELELNRLDTKAKVLTGTAKKTIEKQAETLRNQIKAVKRELDEPVTDSYEKNSRGNVETGRL